MGTITGIVFCGGEFLLDDVRGESVGSGGLGKVALCGSRLGCLHWWLCGKVFFEGVGSVCSTGGLGKICFAVVGGGSGGVVRLVVAVVVVVVVVVVVEVVGVLVVVGVVVVVFVVVGFVEVVGVVVVVDVVVVRMVDLLVERVAGTNLEKNSYIETLRTLLQ